MESKITVTATIKANTKKVWDYYTQPKHIMNWNFADPSWHCPAAENDLRVGGRYFARMEARDGSFGFDFIADYVALDLGKSFSYTFADRRVDVSLNSVNDQTEIVVSFDPETENPVEMQREGWQSILNNFKVYTESV